MTRRLRNTGALVLWAVLWTPGANAALDSVVAEEGGHVSTSGHFMEGTLDLQFGVRVEGTPDVKIERIEKELKLLRFGRDTFPQLFKTISYSGTNLPISQCLAELSQKAGRPIPILMGTNDFRVGQFTFEEVSLLDALRYLMVFGRRTIEVRENELVMSVSTRPAPIVKGGTSAQADQIVAGKGGSSFSGEVAADFSTMNRVYVSGTPDQEIGQLEREDRLLRFGRDSFPQLFQKVTCAQTNVPIAKCLADLSRIIGAPIPMSIEKEGFQAKQFVFKEIPLLEVLKYLTAFDDGILDVNEGKLVCSPVRKALALDESAYELLHLMTTQKYDEVAHQLAGGVTNVAGIANSGGQTLLHLAAWRNQRAIAERLITLGADVNARDQAGYTALHEAARFDDRQCVELLLLHGADPNIKDNSDSSPLETALYYGYLDVANLLADNGAALDLDTAAALGRVELTRKFLDQAEKERAEALKRAARETNSSQESYAVGPIPARYRFGYGRLTPLDWAARGGSVETAELLITRGTVVSAADKDNALFCASERGHLAVAKFLVEHGADVNATNESGWTPLLTAARDAVSPELTKFLIHAGAQVNAKDISGENALHKLAWYGYPEKNVETARLLLEAGADIHARNADGHTPLDVLLDNEYRNIRLVELYRKYDRNGGGAQ